MTQKIVDPHKLSTMTMCSLVLNSNDGYTFLSIKKQTFTDEYQSKACVLQ